MNKRALMVVLVVLIGIAVGLVAHLVLRIGWVWSLVLMPLVIFVLGLVAQIAGILSREEPK